MSRDREWISKKYNQIGQLRELAENPSTTEAEAENARARIEQIEEHIRLANEEYLRERNKRINKGKKVRKATLSDLNAKGQRSNVSRFETKWPFGWMRRDEISVVSIPFPLEKKIVLEWKCPSCGMNVERVITPRHRARLMGRPKGVERFIEDIRGGKLNQLCDDCWKKYQ